MRRGLVTVGIASMAVLSMAALGLAPVARAAPAGPEQPVIIVLRDQLTGLPDTTALAGRRTQAVDEAQRAVLDSLESVDATHVHPLHLIDAVAATIPASADAALMSNPAVSEVVPNARLRGPTPVSAPVGRTGGSATRASLSPGTCPAPGGVQLDPEGVEAVHAVSPDRRTPTARSLGFTGAGVTVGDMAVGIDPATAEMVRPDGQHVISHYVDFTGEGTGVKGGEDLESYLDDSLMAAQGRLVYDLHDYSPMPKGCDIRLQGVAPGITIDAYKVYGDNVYTTTSAFLEAIDYAVTVDHVNVLNEESGSFPFPDTSQDLVKMANRAAMAAGTVITSPSYDAGLENTIWSPSSQPGVISVGASTVFRSYAQDDIGDYTGARAKGWVSDNVSSLSSGGATEQGRSIDVVAPGDLDWIMCQKGSPACGPYNLVLEGGTSESGPIAAAVSALVIQAYRSTHGGATPSVPLVRNIISSTADDLDSPGAQQGAGLVDAYRAVRAAMAAPGPGRSSTVRGGGLVADQQQLDAVGKVGATASLSYRLTNEGSRPTTVHVGARTLGPATVLVRRTVQFGADTVRRVFTVDVPSPVSRLTADIAYPGTATDFGILGVSLVDPQGRFAAYSLPNGTGNHGHADVHDAGAGRWTVDVNGGGYKGPVSVEIGTAMMQPFGTVSPRTLTLAPGASHTVSLRAPFPLEASDQSASVTWDAAGLGHSSLPVTLRSLVPIVDGVGHFSGVVEGGNGRGDVPAQTFFYSFDVGAGRPALDVQTLLARKADDPYYGFLIAPDGESAAQSSNQLLVGLDDGQSIVQAGPGMRLHTLAPAPGRWTVIISFTNPVNGYALTTPLHGTVDFRPETFTAEGLPDSPTDVIAPGAARTIRVTVHNSGDTPESYFLDGRIDQLESLTLHPLAPAGHLTLPLTYFDPYPQWIVPTDSAEVTASAVSSAPTTFDVSPYNGEPDVGATVHGDTATATVFEPELSQGDWDIVPQPIGPYGAKGAPASTTSLSMSAVTEEFDPSLSSSTGDLWEPGPAQGRDFAPVIVQPGQSTTLYAVIEPTASPGTIVHGVLHLDDADLLSNAGLSPSGNQLASLPYTYKV